jgi:hypothetical protein
MTVVVEVAGRVQGQLGRRWKGSGGTRWRRRQGKR